MVPFLEVIMKVKQIVSLAARLAEREDLTEYLKGDLYDPASEREIERLIECFRIVEQDIATGYLALTTKESMETEDGKIFYASLQKPVVSVLRTEVNDVGVPFIVYPDRIETKRGKVDVVYSYLPNEKGLEDDCEFLKRIPISVVAYGVVSEYCLMNGLYTEASLFDQKYKDSLSSLCAVSPKRRMGARRWF